MLWLALICGDFLILFKKIVTFLDFLRHCFQFCCMYFGWSIPSKKNLCISGRENVLWLGCKTGHVRCPYLISLRWTPCCQMATRKLPPRVATCPGKRREWEVQKFPSVGLFSLGKFSSAAKVSLMESRLPAGTTSAATSVLGQQHHKIKRWRQTEHGGFFAEQAKRAFRFLVLFFADRPSTLAASFNQRIQNANGLRPNIYILEAHRLTYRPYKIIARRIRDTQFVSFPTRSIYPSASGIRKGTVSQVISAHL